MISAGRVMPDHAGMGVAGIQMARTVLAGGRGNGKVDSNGAPQEVTPKSEK